MENIWTLIAVGLWFPSGLAQSFGVTYCHLLQGRRWVQQSSQKR